MNRKQQRILESRIREVMDEPVKLTEDEIEAIRERARRAYQESMNQERQAQQSRHKKSGVLRRVVAVFAIAVGLIVTPVLYTALVPVTIGNADSFVRSIAIWINDQLHLGISFPVSEDESNVIDLSQNSFSSIKDASTALNMPVVYFEEKNISNLTYRGIETITKEDNSVVLFVHYTIGNDAIDISIEQFHNEELLDISSDNLVIIQNKFGEVYVWTTENMRRAVTIYNGFLIEIYGFVPEELFIDCCNSLAVFN